jgi:pimeloyl-ACP methyl ester carboxylesterase
VHYLDEGSGPPLVLVHGNFVSSADFVASGIVASLASRYRVIAFDRPGCGYTERPRDTAWTPLQQAELIRAAWLQLEVENPVVVAHSFGCVVAVSLALAHPASLKALVLLSGYYYPSLPLEIPLFALPASPVIGDVMRFTVTPALARLTGPLVAKQMFAPAEVSASFASYPLSMSRRPSQLRATFEDANFMEPAVKALQQHYRELTMPIEIVAGDADMVINTGQQSMRLARELPKARFSAIAGAGHMVHHLAPDRVLAAIDRVAAQT